MERDEVYWGDETSYYISINIFLGVAAIVLAKAISVSCFTFHLLMWNSGSNSGHRHPKLTCRWGVYLISGGFRQFWFSLNSENWKQNFVELSGFHFSTPIGYSEFPTLFHVMKCFATTWENVHTFLEKNTQVFLTFHHMLAVSIFLPFFTLSSFSWKVEIANFPPFLRLPLRQQNPRKRYVFWNWII